MASGVFHEEMKKLLKEIHAKQEPELKKRWAEKQDMDAVMELDSSGTNHNLRHPDPEKENNPPLPFLRTFGL